MAPTTDVTTWAGELDIFWRVLVAMALGGVLGFEREASDKPAGLRTHMLVAGTAALLVSLGEALVTKATGLADPVTLRIDPLRLVEAIMTGIGFLGAGTILRHGTSIEGLTTAASILFTAALGVAVAVEMWILSVALVVVAVTVLHGLSRLSHRISNKKVADE